MDLFSDEMRRNPFPVYDQLRRASPVFHFRPSDVWMIFDYESVKRALVDHETFSSDLAQAAGHGNPGEWFIFYDPPRHSKLRALRYRSPAQWMPRATRREVKLRDQVIPAGKLVLPMIGSANRDPEQFPDPARFDISRDPNPHLAFGLGVHACLGAPLARLEARIALGDFLARVQAFEYVGSGSWEPRNARHVHGPSRLPLRFTRVRRV